MEYVLLVLPTLLALAWAVRRCLLRRADRVRLARIRASIAEWLTPEWADDNRPPDVAELKAPEPQPDQASFRRFGPGSARYRRGRSA